MVVGKVVLGIIGALDNDMLKEKVVQGVRYYIAEPEQEYHVQVQLLDIPLQLREQYLQVYLTIDGKRLSYSFIAWPSLYKNGNFACTFKGFKTHRNVLNAFKFAQTVDATTGSGTVDENTGKISVDVLKSERNGVPTKGLTSKSDLPTTSVVLSEGIKFWKQPSLFTKIREQNAQCLVASVYYHTVGQPILTAHVQYQTKPVLDLRESVGLPISMLPIRQRVRQINDLTEDESPAKQQCREEGEEKTGTL